MPLYLHCDLVTLKYSLRTQQDFFGQQASECSPQKLFVHAQRNGRNPHQEPLEPKIQQWCARNHRDAAPRGFLTFENARQEQAVKNRVGFRMPRMGTLEWALHFVPALPQIHFLLEVW